MEPSKSDWKLYREKVGEWQEHYMENLIKEYSDYLCSDLPASDKFWELEKRIRRDREALGVCIELKRSNMFWDIAGLIQDEVISTDDLEEFSDDVKEAVALILKR
ncbi:MAG: multidrug transporter [Clostridiales bacterium]|nr:multidrug transporter [Clostridiales bacterium]